MWFRSARRLTPRTRRGCQIVRLQNTDVSSTVSQAGLTCSCCALRPPFASQGMLMLTVVALLTHVMRSLKPASCGTGGRGDTSKSRPLSKSLAVGADPLQPLRSLI